jgi:hypothetical protein
VTAIHNEVIRLELTAGPNPTLVISGRRGDGWAPVLRRAGRSELVDGALRASIPDGATAQATRFARATCLVVRGAVPGGTLSLAAFIAEDDPWIEITETLVLDERTAPPVARLDAQWALSSWQEPGEVFSPHLVPEPDDIVGAHCLRTPVVTAQDAQVGAAIVQEVDAISRQHALGAFMSLLRQSGVPVLTTGLVGQVVRGHVFFRATHASVKATELFHAYHVYAAVDREPGAVLFEARRHAWSHFGKRALAASVRPWASPDELAEAIYPRALAARWREADLESVRVGAITTDRAFPGDVWMCPWFHNLSTAYGLLAWGKKLGHDDWVDKARAVRELHLAAPLDRGLFPTLFVFGDNDKPCRWLGSHPQGGGLDVLHVADMSYTLYWLLVLHRELAQDRRTAQRATAYASALRALSREDGGLPAYVSSRTHEPVTRVDAKAWKRALAEHPGGDAYIAQMIDRWGTERFLESAEDAASLMFLAELLKLADLGDDARREIRAQAERLARWVITRVVEPAWYVDMEVHWSCAPNPLGLYDHRSGQHPQDLVAVYAAAHGLMSLYETVRDEAYLRAAARAMDRLCLYQQVHRPPFLSFDGFGGYPAQNTDGEWSDARQALFVMTHWDFYRLTGENEHIERARAACRASFSTLFHPAVAGMYPVGWSRTPTGFAAENHGHGGLDRTCGVSSFHWGAGSALMAAAYLDRRGVAPW